MARILAISSFVSHGHVGLGAIVPALQRLEHETIALPSVFLSNHPGHPYSSGMNVPVAQLASMLDALDGNGLLAEVDAVLTGYLPSVAHVRFAAEAASRVSARNDQARIFCDPVLGDDPDGLYIEEEAARALSEELVPLADMIFPNRFELAYLARREVEDPGAAVEAIAELGVRQVLATSIPSLPDALANVLVVDGDAAFCTVERRERVPHGTGDLLSALFVGHRLKGGLASVHLGVAVAGVEAAVAASLGHDELQLEASQALWAGAVPLLIKPL